MSTRVDRCNPAHHPDWPDNEASTSWTLLADWNLGYERNLNGLLFEDLAA